MSILAIDLGTTNSACAVWQGSEVKTIPNRLGELLTPSVVGLDNSGEILVGQAAKERLITHPGETVAVFKRLMGTGHRIEIGKLQLSAPELSSLVLKSLKKDAQEFLGEEINEAVISVPAYFNDNQRYATKRAGEMAGLKVRRIINEPTAAAMAYGLHEKKEGLFVIVDLGGGTLDVTLLEFFEGVMQVHASAGDNYLGGEDFVNAMADAALKSVGCDGKTLTREEKHQLNMKMETAKRRISGPRQEVAFTLAGEHRSIPVDSEWFSQVAVPLLLRVQRPIENAIRDAGVSLQEIDEVVLVGGSTRLAAVRSVVGKLFRRLPATTIDPDFAIVKGAAVQAGLIEKDAALDDLVLTDVCPFTLGIQAVENVGAQFVEVFCPIIERNTTVPVSRVESFSTVQDKQTEITIRVFQGESRSLSKNIPLGSLDVSVPSKKAGEESVDVRFSYDASGILDVDVTVASTGRKYNKVIKNSPANLSENEFRKSLGRLEKLKFHPRDQEVNRVLMARAERLYESLLGDDRRAIGEIIAVFEAALSSQDEMVISKTRKQFEQQLEEFDLEEWH